MVPIPELPDIRENAVLNAAQFVGELQAMAAEANKAAEAFAKLLAEIKAVQGVMDSMAAGAAEAAAAEETLASAEESVGKAAAGAGAGVAAAAAAERGLAASAGAAAAAQNAVADASNSAAVAAAHVAAAENAAAFAESEAARAALLLAAANKAASASADDAGGAAGRAAIGFRLWGVGLGLTRNALHWVVAGAAEFLAVAVPATYALAAGLAVAAQGAQNVQQHFSALYAATESTYSAMHQTIGTTLGLGDALQKAQNAANPGVYEILGAAINSVKGQFGDFASTGLQVVHMFDQFAAKVTVDMQGALGTELHSLLNGAVTDLSQFGQVLGNIGHALLNFAAAMPGLAHVLLDVALGLSAVIRWASQGGVFITLAMGLEEMYRWGGLVLGMLVRLTGATAAMEALGTGGFIFRFGAALLALVGVGGQVISWIGNFIARMAAAVGASEAFGAAISQLGFDIQIAAATMSPLMVAGIAALVAGLAVGIVMISRIKDATDQWVASSNQAVSKASDLNVLPTIYTQLADSITRSAAAQRNYADVTAHTATQTGEMTARFGEMNGAQQRAAMDTTELAQHMLSLVATANTVRGNISLLAGVFHTSQIGALALANAAGVNLQVGLTKGSEAAKIAEQQITNLRTGLGAMQAPATEIGADMEAIGVQSQLASSKVSQVNQAMDAFIAGTTGGMNSIMQFNAALSAMGKDTTATSQSITGQISSISRSASNMGYTLQGIGPKAQQSWQQFDAAAQQANTVLDTFRVGMAEGVVTQAQYTREIQAVGGALLPFAAHNRTALGIVSQLAQEMGGPATTNLRTLANQFGVTGKKAQEMATTGMEQAVARMSNLNTVARNLSASISGQLDSAMAGAIVKASGLDQAYQKWATAVMNKAPAQTLAADLRSIQNAQNMVNSTEQKATSLLNNNKTAATAYGGALKGAAGDASSFGSSLDKTHPALQAVEVNAKTAALSTQGFGTQARTAGTSASGLSSNASQATAQVTRLGSASNVTRGSLGTVNNEIRTTASAASGSAGPLSAMSANIARVGSSAAAAAGQVNALATAINNLPTSHTITITTVMNTVHRAGGGPVAAGMPYIVGEQGQELFVPSQSGFIVPAPQTQQIMSGGGGNSGGGAQAQAGPIHLTAEIHTHAYLDSKEVFKGVQTQAWRWGIRNSGAPGPWTPS